MNVSDSAAYIGHNILFADQGITISISIYRQFAFCIENSGFHNTEIYI